MQRRALTSIVAIVILAGLTGLISSSTAHASVSFQGQQVITGAVSGDATSPNIAVGPDHTVHVIFQGPSATIRYMSKPAAQGAGWSPPLTIANGIVPAIAVTPQNLIHVVYLRDGVIYHRLKAPTSNWSTETLVSSGTDALAPDVAATLSFPTSGPRPEIHVVWSQGGEIYERGRTAFGTWTAITSVTNGSLMASEDPAVAVSLAGTTYVVWHAGTDGTVRYSTKAYKASAWSAAEAICCSGEPGSFAAWPDVTPSLDSDGVWAVYAKNTGWWDIFEANIVSGTEVTIFPVSKTEVESTRPSVATAMPGAFGSAPHVVYTEFGPVSGDQVCTVTVNTDICYRNGWGLHHDKFNVNVSVGPGFGDFPAVASFQDDRIHVVWSEAPSGEGEIFYNVAPPTDTDGDTLSDVYETNLGCLSPTVPERTGDADGDGLNNELEYLAGTDPCTADTDADGCADSEELGSNEGLGGKRNPLNFWDFYDVPTGTPLARDKIITVGDIGAVVARFGSGNPNIDPLSAPPPSGYHTAYDRSSIIPGTDPWLLQPPDGTVSVGDIGAVQLQFGHSCVAAP